MSLSLFGAVPPLISSTTSAENVLTVGRSLRMDCDAAGDPAPAIHWLKDGTDLTELELLNVHILREGRYSYPLFARCALLFSSRHIRY